MSDDAHHHSSHDHLKHHHHSGDNIALAFWLNTGFAIVELFGGFYTNSVAILSDALHDLGDSLSLGTAWFFDRKSKQKRDETYTYGYKRFSLVGAFVNGIVLIVGSVFIIREAVERLFHPLVPDTTGMIIFAVVGVVVNGIAMLRLRKGSSINERIISLHFLEDVLGWAAVLVGSIIMKFVHAPFIDPLLSILIAFLILFNVYKNIKAAFRIVLQGVPHNVSEKQVKHELKKFSEVEDTHDVRIWTMDGTYNILTAHVVLKQPLAAKEIEALRKRLKEKLKEIHIGHATIEFESRDLSEEED